MQRIIDLAGGLLVLAGIALIGVNAVQSPVADDRAWLAAQTATGTDPKGEEQAAQENFDAWQASIAKRPQIWKPISPEPVAEKPAGPPPCKPPSEEELRNKLAEAGVRFTKAQIGKKVKIMTGNSKRGEFIAEGESIKGFTLVSFDRTSVLLSFTFACPDKSKMDLQLTVPRD